MARESLTADPAADAGPPADRAAGPPADRAAGPADVDPGGGPGGGSRAGAGSGVGWAARGAPELRVGPGVLAEAGAVLTALRIRRPLLVTDPGVLAAGWPDRVAAVVRAAGLPVRIWAGITAGPRVDAVDRCRDALLAGDHDGLLAVGGGSVLDVAKACSGLVPAGGSVLDHERLDGFAPPGPPVVAVPTTPCGGGEVSGHAVIATATGRRFAVGGRWLVPRAVLADPGTVATTPAPVAADTVIDSLLHAIEAYLARAASPYTDLLARAAVSAISTSAVPALAGDGAAPAGSMTQLMTGCLTAGLAMANANAGAVHALGYPLTSVYGISHGRANALVAGPVLRAMAAGRPDRYAELARLCTGPAAAGPPGPGPAAAGPSGTRWWGNVAAPAGDLAGAVEELLGLLGVATGLAGHGVPAGDLPELARLAGGYGPVLRNAPVRLAAADLLRLYELAWPAGDRVDRAREDDR
ncbi:MAG: hypothetical protein V7637_996 [Mycobacteriales bacterium]